MVKIQYFSLLHLILIILVTANTPYVTDLEQFYFFIVLADLFCKYNLNNLINYVACKTYGYNIWIQDNISIFLITQILSKFLSNVTLAISITQILSTFLVSTTQIKMQL